jgi:hypothetical protein
LYRQALRHSSAVPDDRPDLPDNERLEFLGDAVLDAIDRRIALQHLCRQGRRFPDAYAQQTGEPPPAEHPGQTNQIERLLESNLGRNAHTSVPGNAWRP